MNTIKTVINQLVTKAVSATALVSSLRNSSEFKTYLNALDTVLTFEGKTSNVNAFTSLLTSDISDGQIVKLIAINSSENRNIDKNSFLPALKQVLSKKAVDLTTK